MQSFAEVRERDKHRQWEIMRCRFGIFSHLTLRIEYGCIFLFSKDLGVSILDILGVYFVYLLHLTQIEPVKLAGDANVSIFHQTA